VIKFGVVLAVSLARVFRWW